MRLGKFLFWWVSIFAAGLLYVSLDAYLNPEEMRATLRTLTLLPDPDKTLWEKIVAASHAGARVAGVIGWGSLLVHLFFISGFLTAVVSLMVREEEEEEDW